MTRIFTFLTLFIAAVAAQANTVINASTKYVRQNVNVKLNDITELVTNTMIDIEYTQSNTQKVEVYAPDNLIKYIKIELNGNSLSVKFNQSLTIKGNCTVKMIVSAPSVTTFRTNSSGDIKLMNNLNANGEVKCITNSAGDIKGSTIEAPSIKLMANSSGDISFNTLSCTTFNGYSNSSGDIKCQKITAVKVSLSANSAGDVYGGDIVCDNISASTNSSGDVNTKSINCSSLNATASSSGNLKLSGITADNVYAASGSSGDIILSGYCTDATLSASSSSDIVAYDLKARNVNATTGSAASSITFYATDRMKIYKARNSTIKNTYTGFITSVISEN